MIWYSLTEENKIKKTKMLRKDCWSPRQMLPPKCNLPPLKAKIVIPPPPPPQKKSPKITFQVKPVNSH